MKAGLVSALLCAFALASCQYSPGIADRSVAYNEAIAQSTNEILLLNMLRARDREPTYYTRSTSDTATTTIAPSLSALTPIGPLHNGTARASLSALLGGSSQTQVALQNLDDQNFMRGIMTPVSTDVLGFYLREGWPQEILFMTTVSRISMTKAAIDKLSSTFDADCAEPQSRADYCNLQLPAGLVTNPSVQFVTQQVQSCEADEHALMQESTDRDPQRLTYVFDNYPTNPTLSDCFRWMMRLVIALSPRPAKRDALQLVAKGLPQTSAFTPGAIADLDKDKLVLVVGPNRTFDICKLTEVTTLELARVQGKALTTGEPRDSSTLVSENSDARKQDCAALATSKIATDDPFRIELTTRSFDGMIYYIGEVLRAQKEDNQQTSVWIWDGHAHRYADWNLFVAAPDDSDIFAIDPEEAVTVKYQGQTYVVPRSCNDSEVCSDIHRQHRSLQVLALLNQIWGLEKQESEMPIVPTVTVVNP